MYAGRRPSNVAVSKTVVGATPLPRVRIPPPPLEHSVSQQPSGFPLAAGLGSRVVAEPLEAAHGLGLRGSQPGSARVRLARRFVAWQDGLTPAIVVHDLVRGRRAFAIRMRRAEISGCDLAPDGAVVLAAGPRS